jgi:hypothetical protein
VRRSIASLDPNGPEIASLRRGIRVMQSRPATDPTSWIFQANMHGTYDVPTTPQQTIAWNQCQHGSFFFFSWHRMYLYYFERILRAASGDSTLTLPYWNYSDPRQRSIPLAYRQPADPSANPLFTANRAGPMNGGSRLPAGDVDVTKAFADLIFETPHSTVDSFGGQTEPQAIQFDTPFGDLETTPHNVVHVDIGGSRQDPCVGGWMTDPHCSAKDPVFFLHHANIDRLWKRWLALGGGRADPTGDQVWMNTIFTFFDETGKAVQKTGKDVLDTVAQLNYCYDDDPGCQGPGFTWSNISNTTGFGNISSDPIWIGDFGATGHSQVLFYSPGDDNWWLGSFNGSQLAWNLVGNTVGFGHRINDGRPFWIGRFSATDRDQVLFYYPGDDNWWLGTVNGTQLTWNLAGNTSGFGHGINDGRPFWIGDFNGDGKSDVLFYYPGDDNWWLGSISSGSQLTWSLVSNTIGFGHAINDGRPFWIGAFNGMGRSNVLFYYPNDGNWWLATDNSSTGKFDWALVSSTRAPTDIDFGDTSHDPTWIGDFTAVGHSQVLFYYPGDGNWWLGNYVQQR